MTNTVSETEARTESHACPVGQVKTSDPRDSKWHPPSVSCYHKLLQTPTQTRRFVEVEGEAWLYTHAETGKRKYPGKTPCFCFSMLQLSVIMETLLPPEFSYLLVSECPESTY